MNKKCFMAYAGGLVLAGCFFAVVKAADNAPRPAAETTGENGCTPAQIESALLALQEGAEDRTVEKATALLEEAGKDAFPVLLKHLSNQRAASRRHFKSETWEIDPRTHLLQGRRPVTIGELAFQFIQNAIEENFPRRFKIFQVLTKENVAAWLAQNRFLSLFEMRAQAAQEALRKAEAQHRLDHSEHTTAAVQYMKNLVARYATGG